MRYDYDPGEVETRQITLGPHPAKRVIDPAHEALPSYCRLPLAGEGSEGGWLSSCTLDPLTDLIGSNAADEGEVRASAHLDFRPITASQLSAKLRQIATGGFRELVAKGGRLLTASSGHKSPRDQGPHQPTMPQSRLSAIQHRRPKPTVVTATASGKLIGALSRQDRRVGVNGPCSREGAFQSPITGRHHPGLATRSICFQAKVSSQYPSSLELSTLDLQALNSPPRPSMSVAKKASSTSFC